MDDHELMQVCRCTHVALAHEGGTGQCHCGCPEFRQGLRRG